MDRKIKVIIILLMATALFQYGWVYDPDDAEKNRVTLFSSLFDATVTRLGLSYTYLVNQKTELGWGISYSSYDNDENYLKGGNLTLGPMWAHTILFKKTRVGIRIGFNLWISLFSDLKATEGEEDTTKFTARADPRMLFFAELKLGRKVKIYPAIGAVVLLTYMQRTEYEEMEKGLIESRFIVSLPLKIETRKKGYVMIEPVWKIFLYTNLNNTVETFTIRLSYLF